MPNQDEIFQKVSATLVDALNVDEDEIKPTSTLQGDLGAESIDFLDIVFRLEREFGIKIPRNELFPEAIFQGDPEFVQNGKVTCVGKVGNARLKAQFQRVAGGAAVCAWQIPPKAKGKTFSGSVGVVFEGLKASRGYAGKVR